MQKSDPERTRDGMRGNWSLAVYTTLHIMRETREGFSREEWVDSTNGKINEKKEVIL